MTVSYTSILLLSSYLYPGLRRDIFLSGFADPRLVCNSWMTSACGSPSLSPVITAIVEFISVLLLLPPSWFQIFPSSSCAQTPATGSLCLMCSIDCRVLTSFRRFFVHSGRHIPGEWGQERIRPNIPFPVDRLVQEAYIRFFTEQHCQANESIHCRLCVW